MEVEEADFSGWVTKAAIVCSDGRTIMPDAFKHQDKKTVPLVWQHNHNAPGNVLGKVLLENRPEGVYGYAFFNKNSSASEARELVEHGDINQMSIWANQLVERAKQVYRGAIKEVSLVLGGANPGAFIDAVAIRHSLGDGDFTIEELEDQVIIYTGEQFVLTHSSDGIQSDDIVIKDPKSPEVQHTNTGGSDEMNGTTTDTKPKTKKDIYDSLDEDQQNLVKSMIAHALSDDAAVEDEDENPQAVYDSLNDDQRELFHSMVTNALEQSYIEHADGNTVKEIYMSLNEEQKQLCAFLVGQALSGEELKQSDMEGSRLEHADSGRTLKDVYESMSDKQKDVLHFLIGDALDAASGDLKQDSLDDSTGITTNDKKGEIVHENLFEKNDAGNGGTDTKTKARERTYLSHDDMESIFDRAQKEGSLKAVVTDYALAHEIGNIDYLFPDAQAVDNVPEFLKRATEWVSVFLGGAHKSPFSRIKTLSADLTEPEARAKGYIKGTLKKEEFFRLNKRTTTPTTVYKKQKLDRDDVVDITDFDVVAWLKAEMRIMLDEEIARAGLLGDGRESDDPDKIDEESIRPIYGDHELYATVVNINLGDASSSILEIPDKVAVNRSKLKGSGLPVFFTSEVYIGRLLTARDSTNRKIYKSLEEVASEMRVSRVVPVEPMEEYPDLIGILVNPADYTYGATRGGEVTMFDDFDIDYNQMKYLIETRCCGALTKLKSALVLIKTADATVFVTALAPTFDPDTGELVINDTAHVVYKHGTDTLTNGGGPYTVPSGETWLIEATAAAGYSFETSDGDSWNFTAD